MFLGEILIEIAWGDAAAADQYIKYVEQGEVFDRGVSV